MHTTIFDPVDELTRRGLLTGGAAGLLIAAGIGVGPADGAEPEDGAFPVTIEHKYGSTTIPAQPKRIVCVGELEQDTLLALGVVPVATSKWLGEYPGAIYPWAQDKLGDGPVPEALDVFTAGPQFERIAALRPDASTASRPKSAAPAAGPDLILALFSFIERADYNKLAQIAPTVAQPKGFVNYGAPWQLMTRSIGRAVGQHDRADQLVAGVEAQLAQVRAAHPEFAGATAVVARPGPGGNYSYWPPPSPSGQFLADLGFELPAELAELAGGQSFFEISGEQLDLLDTDVLVWLWVQDKSQREEIRANPLYAGLDVATQGRDIFLFGTDVLNEALTVGTVLSIPFLLDRLVPLLAAAVDGDPATTTEALG
ncbi:MAG: iron-siderophore ABC transporter substrate-binding protein [Egibacteraceae bacterium]